MPASRYASNEASKTLSCHPSLDFTQRVDLFTANQLHRLEKQISRRLEQMVELEQKLHVLDTEIADFIEHYYSQVGDLCAQIEHYETELAHVVPQNAADPLQVVNLQKHVKHNSSAQDADLRKTLYRRLVKQFHPDLQITSKGNKQAFLRIQSAYESGRTCALWQVEWEQLQTQLRQCELTDRMRKLTEWFRQCERYGQALTTRYLERKESPEAVLLSRYMQSRLSGKDWFGSVKQRLSQHAEQTKHQLVCAKILAHQQ